MDELARLRKYDPAAKCVNLELMEIEDLAPLMLDLSALEEMRELQLFGNRLTGLPADMSSLLRLEILDVSNNYFSEADSIIDSLRSLPELRELLVTLRSEQEEVKLARHLPNLRTLNGESVKSALRTNSPLAKLISPTHCEIRFEESELQTITDTYDAIRALWRSKAPEVDKVLMYYFDANVKQVMNGLNSAMCKANTPSLKAMHVLKAKYDLNSVCMHKLCAYNQSVDKKAAALEVDIVDTQKKLFAELIDIVVKLSDELSQVMPFQGSALPAAQERLQAEVNSLRLDKELLKASFATEKQEFMDEIVALQEENQKYLATIIKHSKRNADHALTPSTEDREVKPLPASSPLVEASGKVLTLNQTRDAIEEIYLSKAKYDDKCRDTGMPMETLEQHLITYLNQKYGLKSLIVDWAAALIRGVKAHASQDNDVAVFGMIMRNEIEEDFRHVQSQVKKTVADLVIVRDR